MHSSAKFLLVLVALVAVIRLTEAAVGMEIVEASPDDPNKCFRKSDKLTLAIGESKINPNCYEETCIKEGNKMIIRLEGCGSVGEVEGCTKTEDKTKPYPNCCPQITCP